MDASPRGDYAFEVKWDGFRAIVSTDDGLRVRHSLSAGELVVQLSDAQAELDVLVCQS